MRCAAPPKSHAAAGRRAGRAAAVAAALAAFVLGALPARGIAAAAQRDDRITILPGRAIAPRGGVMAIALDPVRPEAGWPRTVPVRLADGRTLTGRIAVAVAGPPGGTSWTTAAVPRRVRAASDLGPREPILGVPRLLVELPIDADGSIRVAGTILDPAWADPRARYTRFDLPGPQVPRLRVDELPPDARPDPDDPFEHWRWVLLADREGLRPPSPDRFAGAGPEAVLLARSEADRWRIGLARIGAASPGVAAACRDVLVARAIRRDGSETAPLAAWEADPAALASLLQVLLDLGRDPATAAETALAWADARRDWIVWPGAGGRDDGRTVELEVMHRRPRDLAVELRWGGPSSAAAAGADGAGAIPGVEAIVGPLETRGFRMARPDATRPGPEPPAPRPALGDVAIAVTPPPVLEVALGDDRLAVAFPPRWIEAVPPAAALPNFRPVLRLVEAARGEQAPIAAAFATAAQLRRREGRWELFVECRRPASVLEDGDDELEIRIGTETTPSVSVRVSERGALTVPPSVSGRPVGEPAVHRRSWGDRWYLRLVLPAGWIDEARIGVGIVRRTTPAPGAPPLVQSSPAALAPGTDDPGRHLVDLAAW